MDRNREARRGVTMAASNGLSRRRHRSRDFPEEDGKLDLRETARLRDRKKDRDRELDRERERGMLSRISKRRRSDKFMHASMREEGGDETSEESVNDDEDDDDDDGGGGNSSSMRILPPNPSTSSSSMLNHHDNHQHHHHHHNSNNHNSNSNNNNNSHIRRSFPLPPKVFRGTAPSVTSATTTTTTTSTWKAAEEMIGVSVPRKARSASTKRSHDWAPSGGPGTGSVGEEKIHRQASTSPVSPSVPIVMAAPAPASPPPNNLSIKKKMKPNGPKLRPPKSSSHKSPSSAQDEIEIEIAEVLYGMMRQPQGPSKQEIVCSDSVSLEIDINNNNIKSRNEAKSRVSSPISNSPSTLPLSSSILPANCSSSTAPMADIAPKRKRPRPVRNDGENPSMYKVRNTILTTTKNEMDQSAKTEPSQNLEKHSATAAGENGSISLDLVSSQASELQLESKKPDSNGLLADSKCLTEESESGRGDLTAPKEEPRSPKKESAAGLILDDDRRDNVHATKANSMPSEEKFQIDLMAPPLRSSRERDAEIDSVAVDLQPKPAVKEDEKEVKTVKDNASVEAEEKKSKTVAEESESQEQVVGKKRDIDLHLDLEKSDRDNCSFSLTGNNVHQHVQKKPQQPSVTEKTAQSNSLPLPVSMASLPGGLPPMGYMAPLQGVVSMDGSAVSSSSIQPPHLLSSQPRPKRCATHCYIARNIHYHQQFMKMYPFWPPAAGWASLYGAKAACNLNVVSPTELHGTFTGRGVDTVTDKGQNLAIFPSHAGKDSKSSQPATIMDAAAAQRKQVLLQQALSPGAPSKILHAPAFIFPLSQQQAPAAAVRPGSVKSPPAASKNASSSASNSAIVSASASAGTAATAMSFNFPNMSGNETQYLAILQNNGYPFPISTHVGLPPAYRGTHARAMPFFNGSFYSSQMLHPSQFQQQQPLPTQSQQTQQGYQNTSISSGSSSSPKHLQNQQQRLNSSGINGSSVTLQGFPTPKNQAQVQLQQRQQRNQQVPYQARQHESETGGEESPSTADSGVSHANMNIYGQNFAMPLRPLNFALMTTAPTSTSEKKPQRQQGSKAGVESLTPQTFAMTFASINGAATAPGFDISSIAQNPALQSLPEAVTHGYQIMAAAQAAQQNKNYRVPEEVKTGGNDPSNAEEERKSTSGKPPATVGQSIAFSRQDLTDVRVSAMKDNTILDSSTRTLNLGSVPARSNVSVMPASMSNSNASAAQQQLQRSQQQHQQMVQIQQQQQFAAAAAAAQRSKNPATTSSGSVHSDHLHASSVAGKLPNAFSVFPQNLVQSSSSQAQSPQWKNSGRTNTSQFNSQSLSSSTTSSLKNLPHPQGQTQISFAANPKSSSAQGQTPPGNNQSASPPPIAGSPRTSISKTSASGSPRTTATTSRSTKCGQTSLSSQKAKNSPSMPSRKSSPVPSIVGNPNISSSSTGTKQQMSEQQQQQQLSKHAFQPAQQFFSNAAYMQAQAQAQAQHAASTTSSASAQSSFVIQRHREQQKPGSSATSSSGVLSLCPPVTHSSSGTSDPDKAVAAACNIKGLSSRGLVQTGQFAATQSSGKQHQLVPPGFQNVHIVPTPVQVKPSEQKQPDGE